MEPPNVRPLPMLPVHGDHRRSLGANRYAYAVVSRRSKGVSVGLNLNPDKVCNFACVYCQVDRTTPGPTSTVDVGRLCAELEDVLDQVASGRLFQDERFRGTPSALRTLRDIAFSGDGEPTSCPAFAAVVRAVAQVKQRRRLDEVKLVLLSNASLFHRPTVQEGLRALLDAGGEVWAKLDAGTEPYYRLIDRSAVPLGRVLANLALAARLAPLVIQAMFLRLRGAPPSAGEIEAFGDRLNEVVRGGGVIKGVQVYTVARQPAEEYVTPLSATEVEAVAEQVRRHTGLLVEAFAGLEPQT